MLLCSVTRRNVAEWKDWLSLFVIPPDRDSRKGQSLEKSSFHFLVSQPSFSLACRGLLGLNQRIEIMLLYTQNLFFFFTTSLTVKALLLDQYNYTWLFLPSGTFFPQDFTVHIPCSDSLISGCSTGFRLNLLWLFQRYLGFLSMRLLLGDFLTDPDMPKFFRLQ